MGASIFGCLVVQSLCGRTSNPLQYLDFGDNISLIGMLKYIQKVWGPMSRAKKFTAWPSKILRAPEATKLFICCFGDITKDNCPKI